MMNTITNDNKEIHMISKHSFYKSIIPLNSNKHLTMKISDVESYSFVKATNASILTTTEFEKGSKTYPILFVLDDEDFLPVALLGLEDKQNVFLKWNHLWDADYIPADIRRYPFTLANDSDTSEYIVCIDEKSSVIGKSEANPLFLDNGKYSKYLNEKIRFLQEFQVEYEKTIKFTKKLNDLELFESMSANVSLINGSKLSVSGFYIINKQKLKNLDAKILKELIENDEMKFIYEHFSSLDNLSKLVDRIMERKIVSKSGNKKILNKVKKQPESKYQALVK